MLSSPHYTNYRNDDDDDNNNNNDDNDDDNDDANDVNVYVIHDSQLASNITSNNGKGQ